MSLFQPRHAGLGDVFDDLKIEVNEGDMVDEFDNVVVGNDVMLNRNDPNVKKNYILLLQFSHNR